MKYVCFLSFAASIHFPIKHSIAGVYTLMRRMEKRRNKREIST